MGFLAPAVPWIIKGGAMLGGALAGRKAQSSAMKRSPEEMAALGGATGAAQSLTNAGTSLMQSGTQALQGPMSYYQTLLRGSRPAMALATAGPRAAITDQYRGAENSLERSGVRGATRDLAMAQIARDRAGATARLTTGVQPGAAAALGDLSTNLIGQGRGAAGAGGSIYQALLGAGAQNRYYGREEGEKAGTSIGSFLFDILGSFGKKKLSPWGGGGKGDQGPVPY